VSDFGGCRGDGGDERVVQCLEDGEDLGEIGLAGGDNRGDRDLAFADGEGELDRDCVNLAGFRRGRFRMRWGLLVHRQGIVADARARGWG